MLYLLLSLHSLSCPNILDMIQAQKYGYVHDSEYIYHLDSGNVPAYVHVL